MSKYVVDVFTMCSIGNIAENSYPVNTSEECKTIIDNVSKEITGIRLIQIWINEPTKEQ